MTPLKSLQRLKVINTEYYGQAKTAQERKAKVCYVNAFTPVELLYALDIVPIFPENHAVVMAARHQTAQVSAHAERTGFDQDLCSYARIDLGAEASGLSPIGGLPRPDFLLVCNAQCNTLVYWWQVISRKLRVPLFLIDVPQSRDGEEDKAAELYVRSQMEDLIGELEKLTGSKLDPEKFHRVLALSRDGSALWRDIVEMGSHRPSPLTVFDQFIAMAPIVSQRGCQITVDFYQALKKELEDRVASGIAAVNREKYRLYWDNLPLWPELRALADYLEENKASLVTSMYTWAWANLSVGAEDPLDDWTRQYLYFFNFHLRRRVALYREFASQYHVDGFIYHSNRSCKHVSFDVLELKRRVSLETSKPGTVFEADHCDPRHYSLDQIKKQLDTFFSILARIHKEG